MQTSLAAEIRRRLARYVAGELSLESFDRWFVRATAGVDEAKDPDASSLTWEVYLRLAEYTRGDRSEDDLKAVLAPLLVTATAS